MKCADRSLIAFVLGMFACLPWAHAQTPQPPERVKAAFLYNFGLYVEWPKGAAQADQIAIGVLGAEQVAEELRSVVAGRKIQDRPVRVQPLSSLEELDGVHILYVGSQSPIPLSRIRAALTHKPVLLVSDLDGGLSQGAVINFTIVDRRVRFEVSLPAAQEAGLQLSSRLLGAALRVEKAGALHLPDASDGPIETLYSRVGSNPKQHLRADRKAVPAALVKRRSTMHDGMWRRRAA